MTARPPDVDALARRLPRREPAPERAAALRDALLEAAAAPGARQSRAPVRRWMIGGGLAIAAAACAALLLRASAPAPRESPHGTAASAASPPAHPSGGATTGTTAPAAPDAPGDPLLDGVTAIRAARPLQVARGGTRITAPPGAEFDVDVQAGEVRLVTVRSGWVVVAGVRTAATVVSERQTWFPRTASPAAEPVAPPGTAPSTAPGGSPRTASPAAVPAAPASAAAMPATPRGPAPAAEPAPPRPRPPLIASRPPSEATAPDRAAPATSAASGPSPLDVAAQQAAAAEQAFHDGLQALLAGQARAATGPLDRACGLSSTSQDDICYWAAVAWLRAGDRGHARQALSDVLARWPRSTHAGEASVALGWLLLDAGDHAAARARFAAAVDDRMPGVRAEAARGLAAAQ